MIHSMRIFCKTISFCSSVCSRSPLSQTCHRQCIRSRNKSWTHPSLPTVFRLRCSLHARRSHATPVYRMRIVQLWSQTSFFGTHAKLIAGNETVYTDAPPPPHSPGFHLARRRTHTHTVPHPSLLSSAGELSSWTCFLPGQQSRCPQHRAGAFAA